MLRPWQIEKLEEGRREREKQERPALRLPLPQPPRRERPSSHEPQIEQRGVTIINFTF